MNLRPEIQQAAEWLQAEIDRDPFAEVGVRLVTHDGEVTRVEKSIVSKHKLTKPGSTHGKYRS